MQLAAVGPFTFFKTEEETVLVQLSLSFLSLVIKKLLPALTSQDKLGEWFSLSSVRESL